MPKKGYKQNKEHRENISKGQMGRKSSYGFRGKHHTKELKERFKKERKGKSRPEIAGENHPNWQGGRIKRRGYVYVFTPHHPFATKAGYVMEHRLVMEAELGRYLEKWEQVHHQNGMKDDNRITNLQIVIIKKHFGKVRCPYCLNRILIK